MPDHVACFPACLQREACYSADAPCRQPAPPPPAVSDLHSRIRTEVERRLAIARAASPGPWSIDEDGDVLAVDGITTAQVFALSGPQLRATAEYIALHDPVDAIRRYEHALAILDRHYIIHRDVGWLQLEDGELVEEYAELPVCVVCVPRHSNFGTNPVAVGACIEVRDLATSLGLETSDA